MKQATLAAAQSQMLRPTNSAASSSSIVVNHLQDSSRPLAVLPSAGMTVSQAPSLLNCLSPEQQHNVRMHQQLQQQQQKQLQQLQQQNLQHVASNPGQQLSRARLGTPAAQAAAAFDSVMAVNGTSLGMVPFSVARLPQMTIAQNNNSNDAMQQKQQLQLINNQQGCGDSKPPQSAAAAVAPQVRMLSIAPNRQQAPRLSITLPPPLHPMHSQLANHTMTSSSGFRNEHQNQKNDHLIYTQQPSYAMTLGLPGLGHSMTDGDITPLTPQDQLSRYVEQL